MKFHKEKTLNHDFSKKGRQNILKLANIVENSLNFWILAVPATEHFIWLIDSSQAVWYMKNDKVRLSCKNGKNIQKKIQKKIQKSIQKKIPDFF